MKGENEEDSICLSFVIEKSTSLRCRGTISFIGNKSSALRSKDRKKLVESVFVGTNFYSINRDRILVFKNHCQEIAVFLKKIKRTVLQNQSFLV